MTEDEARRWVAIAFDVSRETMARLDDFTALLRAESERQNLVSKSSLDALWRRHIADSAQLISFAPSSEASWVDLGSGAGFPGLIVALLHRGPVTLIEERRLRVDFLRRAAQVLRVEVEIIPKGVERVAARPFDVISARAFAPLGKLLELGTALSTRKTRWVLPKGQNAQTELEALDPSWQGRFELHASMTDADAQIIVADGVHKARGTRQ